jgi:hypothetical protein
MLKIFAIILAFLLLISYYPYVFCQFIPFPNVLILSLGFMTAFSLLLLAKRKIVMFPKIVNYIAIIHTVFCLAFFVFHHDSSYLTRIILFLVSYLAIFALYNVNGLGDFMKSYGRFILLMAIGGCLCFFLILFFSYSPLFVFENIDGRTAYCFGITCTNTYLGNIIRYSGFFDEPGAMAYWGMFALLFSRLFFPNSKYDNLLIVLLLLTFSLAYYIQLFFYLLFFRIRSKKDFLVLIFLGSIIFGITYFSRSSEFDIYRLTFARLELDEDTGIAGNNRADPTEEAKKNFLSNPIIGIGAKKMENMDYMADNPYEILAKDGIIGWIVTYLPLLVILMYRCRDKRYLYAIFILMIGYLQRPFHINFVHYIVLYAFFVMTFSRLKEKQLITEQ